MKKNQLYWVLQFGGWSCLVIMNILVSIMFLPMLPIAAMSVLTVCLAVFSSHLFRLYIKKRRWLELKVKKLIPKVFLASLLQGSITGLISMGALIFAAVVYIQSNPDALLELVGVSPDSVINLSEIKGLDTATLIEMMGISPGMMVNIETIQPLNAAKLFELMGVPTETTIDVQTLGLQDPAAFLQMMGIPQGTEFKVGDLQVVSSKDLLLSIGVPQGMLVDAETLNTIEEVSMSQFSPKLIAGTIVSVMSQYSLYFISWSALYFAYQFLQKNRQVEIEKWKLQASFKDAELSALKSQVNPHFIFNSLNNIRSLVVEDGEKARDSITHLSDLLRFSIQFDQFEKVSLEKEMEVVKDYLELESIQLEERLNYRFDISKECGEINLPPMIVQTLVENAIKHSINELPNGGQVLVESQLSNDYLKIFVKNSGQLKDDVPGKRKGIGIKNARERLRLLYGEKASLHVENMNEQMVCAIIRIPLD